MDGSREELGLSPVGDVKEVEVRLRPADRTATPPHRMRVAR
jgi:hypothetical protein